MICYKSTIDFIQTFFELRGYAGFIEGDVPLHPARQGESKLKVYPSHPACAVG